MTQYHGRALPRNNIGLPKFGTSISPEPELTRGGRVVKRKRPAWSHALCNVAAELAGIGQQEVRHVG